jgi:hypothetical protein
LLTTLIIFLIATSCASLKQRNPVPEALSETAKVPGIQNARMWGDAPPSYADRWLRMPRDELKAIFPALMGAEHNYLAISGGGANGAFCAGLLSGWSEAGNRPDFSIVTGISTGALAAPFAFLGPSYDARLKEIYTTHSTKDLIRNRQLVGALTSDSAVSAEPMKTLIAKYYDRKVIDDIAAEHLKGRRLLIGTTNLDSGRPVIWSIGYIAASGNPDRGDLIRQILLASASIPAVFPPVYIKVEAGGQGYEEMHVDGGTASQVFLFPSGFDVRPALTKLEVKGTPNVYVIRNSRLSAEWVTVKPWIVPIAGRSIASLIRTQGIGDMYRIYLGARRDKLNYHLAIIPEDFEVIPKEMFDPEYMGKLFDLGYKMAEPGYPWRKAPPGFE